MESNLDTHDSVRVAPSIRLDNLTTVIDDVVVFHELNLDIPAGEVTVLMGPSGVGKTTLIKHIVGLLEPDGGTVWVNDRDIWGSSQEEWREFRQTLGAMIGGSYQITSSSFASLTVLENVTYTLEALGVPYEQRHDRVVARLEELDLVEEANRRPAELPAHAIKRVALARALVTDAPLIVLDEIDLGLDHAHADKMIEALRLLRERTRCTILLTTHNLDLARSISDKLAILVRGKIVAAGSPATLLDGVKNSDDFDRIYEFSEMAGPPPRLEDAESNSERKRRRLAKKSKYAVDPLMVTIAVIAVLVIIGVFLLTSNNLT